MNRNYPEQQMRRIVGWYEGREAKGDEREDVRRRYAIIQSEFSRVVQEGRQGELCANSAHDFQIKDTILRARRILGGAALAEVAKNSKVSTQTLTYTTRYVIERLAILARETR